MLKYIFTFFILLALTQNVSANDVLVFSDDYYDFYVDTLTFSNKTVYRDNRAFDVNVGIVDKQKASSPLIVRYSMWENDGLIWYTVGSGTGMHSAYGVDSALAIWHFGLNFLNLDYDVSYY